MNEPHLTKGQWSHTCAIEKLISNRKARHFVHQINQLEIYFKTRKDLRNQGARGMAMVSFHSAKQSPLEEEEGNK
jgi:hypothetical protein